MCRAGSLEKALVLGKKAGGEGDDRGRDGLRHHRLSGHEFEQAPGGGEGQGAAMDIY